MLFKENLWGSFNAQSADCKYGIDKNFEKCCFKFLGA